MLGYRGPVNRSCRRRRFAPLFHDADRRYVFADSASGGRWSL